MSSIDVIVPCYRYGRFLRQCVESILSQDAGRIRVLIIDDHSPDETSEVGPALAREDTRVTYRRHPVNRGHIATYNEGIEWLKADYMLLLSADDYLLPGSFRRAFALLDADSRIGLCFGPAVVQQADGSTVASRPKVLADAKEPVVFEGADFIRHAAIERASNIVPTPTAIVRTSLLQRVGGYRVDLPHSADFELWLRLAANGRVAAVSAPQAVYRRHENNMSTAYLQDSNLTDLQQRRAAVDAFLTACEASFPPARKLHGELLRHLAREMLHCASDAFNHGRFDQSARLRSMALTADPGVRASRPWAALALKRMLGLRLSSALLPFVSR